MQREMLFRPHPTQRLQNNQTARSNSYQRNPYLLWTASQIRTSVKVRSSLSERSFPAASACPCTGALYPCMCRQPPDEGVPRKINVTNSPPNQGALRRPFG